MESFRTEIEDPIVQKEIIDLERKIALFKDGKIDDERFRSLRLARGVYGQRQEGVQMIRIKLPFGKVTSEQLVRITKVSDEYSTGRLHITTRQDIQIHYVSLDRTPELWANLAKDDITLREACGNTVRNITASELAGVDVDEPFDVSPYAHAMFQFFLRNPICQEMGRKFKMSFSSSVKDTALSYLHDLGFIPKIVNGERGFKVMLGGGLGSQPHHAELLSEFIPVNQIIPTTEGVLRVFDRFGERAKRLKARMKFLIKDIGRDEFLRLVDEEKKALSYQSYEIDTTDFDAAIPATLLEVPAVSIDDTATFEAWKKSNVIAQKQAGYVAIGIKVLLGDFYTDKARALAELIKNYGANELRFSLKQNIVLRNIKEENLPFFYQELAKLDFVTLGYDTINDITACPGTDTCNLGIASSTGIAEELERVLKLEFPQYKENREITIKISGCMNACGQHNMSSIGFQGMSINSGKLVAPALQVLLGGGILGDGKGRFSDKVIKIPSRRGPDALRFILNDFEANANGLSFLDYYDAQGEKYFYEFLKPLADVTNLTDEDFIDWGNADNYVKAVGVGECAGVVIDLVATLILEAKDKLTFAQEAFEDKKWADAIYLAYAGFVNGAKAILLAENEKTNHHAGIINLFDTVFVESNKITLDSTFKDLVYQINQNEPSEAFAKKYIEEAIAFFQNIETYRSKDIADA
ncbi:HEPN domain-containing protein [Flavobacterium sp. F-380]|uniref:HEPN domain-containing protein n=1 Tax=Flavobacterium kayseriense TaxID=2764714 RepID=A0ABR7J6E9_9FLAO|nr:HEPN domain-containing protein [Flavobacterium kayseriense]MBC5840983.1 HEPN domain-containing protein [Flavobacterium kayseriense]MBC5846348.1 HEPN domain-containing protein [Flavobacterium kayseriense]MBU0940639.1 HEPN domain-containing protein [Bacteroidota bacterium]